MGDMDVSIYLGVFLDEVEEQLQILDMEILSLEKNPHHLDAIEKIFRAAHTLKGSSASMGFEKMKECTHYLENIFDNIREKKLEVNEAIINLIFKSIDVIRKLKNEIVTGSVEGLDITAFLLELEAISSKESKKLLKKQQEQQILILDDYQKNMVEQANQLGMYAYSVQIEISKDSLMKQARTLLVYQQLAELGEIIATNPTIEALETTEEEISEITFILLSVNETEEIRNHVLQVSEIDQVRVKLWIDEKMADEGIVETNADKSLIKEMNQVVDESLDDQNSSMKAKVTSTVRVDVDKLDYLMNLVGELVINQTRLVDVRGRVSEKELGSEPEFVVLNEVTNHFSRVIAELQGGMMSTRMLPIEQLFNRFPRLIRDTALKAKKEIDFVIQGKETELDRTLIEEISDPIIHLLRNAVDHGIESPEERRQLGKPEQGKVIINAFHEENHVVISISDDGRGLNPEKIKEAAINKGMITEEEAKRLNDKDAMFLIFKSGVSTAESITDISGRGVGMDIVRSHIEKINGVIDIESTIGKGTTFTIKLPLTLTLAIIRSLLVKFGEKTFAIPLVNVLEIIRLNKEDIQMVKDQEVGLVRGRVLPLVRMKNRFHIDEDHVDETKKREFVVVVGIADKRIGLIVDRTIGNQEIVIKSLGNYIGSPPYISGATIMGDGSVALILDVASIIEEQGTQDLEQNTTKSKKQIEDEKQLVTFKLDSEEYGLEIHQAKDIIAVPEITKVVETAEDLLGVINLRGTMLPVIDLRKRFRLPELALTKKSRIIVVENGEQDVGFLVDEVTQVLKVNNLLIEKQTEDCHYNESKLLKGISKLENRVVLILDFTTILASIGQVNKQHIHEQL